MNAVSESISIESLQDAVGQVIGKSRWFDVDQSLIDQFAALTLDQQFIHVDVEKAAHTDFGGTVAHGFLVLSYLSAMYADAVPAISGAKVAINAGLDRVRFITPVRSGSRVRGSFSLIDTEEQRPGHWRVTLAVDVRIEGATKPALVAEWRQIWLV